MKYTIWFDELSLREQCGFLTGTGKWRTTGSTRLGIPSVRMGNGTAGLSKEYQTVCFPSPSAMAGSWDVGSMHLLGETLGTECRAKGTALLLAPAANLKRSPLGGRNFEYLSEDPVLTGELAAAEIEGIQSQGVGAAVKHFGISSTEKGRLRADSVIDDRALMELYLRPFEIAVEKSSPWAVMASYGKLNGKYVTESSWLLQDVLRDQWHYKGIVLSDWGAVNDRAAALKAGIDLDMPGTGNVTPQKIMAAYRKDHVTKEEIQRSAARVLELAEKADPLTEEAPPALDLETDHEVAVELAEGCPVLLRNERGMLPLNRQDSVAVIGARAKTPLIQGHGSARVEPYRVMSPYDALFRECRHLTYADGYHLDNMDYADGTLIREAVATAQEAQKVLVFVSCEESAVAEGMDNGSMKLPAGADKLIEAVTDACSNVAVILMTASAVEMPWAERTAAILYAGLLGEGAGEALTNILLGKVSPSGKLAESWPLSENDIPGRSYLEPDEQNRVQYRESIYAGYRYYEKAGIRVQYPFGHGLSYVDFDYHDLQLDRTEMDESDTLTVTFTVTNSGGMDAAEVPQLYVGFHDAGESYLYRASKELQAFTKIFLRAGETKTVTFTLDHTAFEYYSTEHDGWQIEPGEYGIYIGGSSKDIRLMGHVLLNIRGFGDLDYRARAPEYFDCDLESVDMTAFEFVLRYHLDGDEEPLFTTESCIADIKDEKKRGRLEKLCRKTAEKLSKDPIRQEGIYQTLLDCPFNRLTAYTHGILSEDMVAAIVLRLDGARISDSAQLVATGMPASLANLLLPAAHKVAQFIPDDMLPAKVKKLASKGDKKKAKKNK